MYDVHLDLLEASRRKSAILLGKRIAARSHRDPVIVVGDLNAHESEAASRYMRGEIELDTPGGPRRIPEPLVDSFRVLHPEATKVGTGHAFRGWKSGKKIDHVYVAAGTTVAAASIDHFNVDGAYPSDHFPVRATVLLTE